MKQQKLFAPVQSKCWNCGQKFIPLAKESIRLWSTDELDWLAFPKSTNWSVDRVYQENLRFCSPECLYTHAIKDEVAKTRLYPKNYGKRK